MGKIFTEKRKRDLIIYLILWLIITIVLIVPAAVASIDSTQNGEFNTNSFLTILPDYMLNLEIRVKAFQNGYIDNTITVIRNFSILYFILVIILMLKKGKGAYHDIEHGSSDWTQCGEQYKVLSRNKGIILAEHNYLPVNKPGNVNVLIVGRIWCW